MNDKRTPSQPAPSSMAVSDIYFVLFRHKWKIIILSVLGILGAAGIYATRGVTYKSEANVWIKYVMSAQPRTPTGIQDQTVTVDPGGDSIINTEIAILESFDLAQTVVTNLGADKILAKAGGGSNAVVAANLLRQSLTVNRLPKSPVLSITFSHPDAALVQPALKQIIEDYRARHTILHGTAGSSFDTLAQERDALHAELLSTEDDLRKAKAKMGVMDLDAMKKENSEQLAKASREFNDASIDLKIHTSILAKLKGSGNNTNSSGVVSTNEVEEVSEALSDKYSETLELLASAKRKYIDLRINNTEHHKLVLEAKEKIDEIEKIKKDLEKQEPRLAKMKAPTSSGAPPVDPIAVEQNTVTGLSLKLEVLNAQLEQLHSESTNLASAETLIVELERKHAQQLAFYNNYSVSAQKAKIDNDTEAAMNGSIQVMDAATPPTLEKTKTPKLMAISALGGIAAGLALAFLSEFYLDHSVRRSKEIANLDLRLFLSIPELELNGHARLAEFSTKKPALLTNGDGKSSLAPAVNGGNGHKIKHDIVPLGEGHPFSKYLETLSDSVVTDFAENNLLDKKPKVVAVTGSARGAGATTIATGLAAALSKTGDGKVLLIDVNVEGFAEKQFYQGSPVDENDAPLVENGDSTKVDKSKILHLVTHGGEEQKISSMIPKHFANVVGRIRKASDYDYIVFDMPPVDRNGVTQRLAGFMDMVLLVVEAEKTSREVAREAGLLLSKPHYDVVESDATPAKTAADLTESKVTESKITESKVIESRETDSKVTESKVTESRVTESKVNGKFNVKLTKNKVNVRVVLNKTQAHIPAWLHKEM